MSTVDKTTSAASPEAGTNAADAPVETADRPAPATAALAQAAAGGAAQAPETKGGFTFPSAYTILFLLIVIFAILTWFIPAGKYNVDSAGNLIPGTYHTVAKNPQKFFTGSLLAPINGMYGIQDAAGTISPYNTGVLYGSIDVALFILVIGGFLGIVLKSGAMDAGIGAAVKKLGNRGNLLIPMLMIIFMIGGTTYGMAEESLAFYVLIISAMIALGYDALTGVATVLLGTGIGTLGSTVNPFATGIASGFANVPLGQGIVGRLVILFVCGAIGIWYVMRYANRVKAEPAKSYVASLRAENEKRFGRAGAGGEVVELTTQRKWVLILFGVTFLIMIVSVIPWSDFGIHRIVTRGWWFPELTALFIFASIVIGIVARMNEQALTSNFIDGARDMLGVALVVAIARGISVVMTNGLILDTILHWTEQALGGLGEVAFINLVFLLYLPLSFLIPSSSGLATVTMPIMAPLAHFNNIPAHLIVTAFQSANGAINLVSPTFAVVIGALAIGRVPLNTWWKFAMPLVGVFAVVVMVVLTVSVLI
jgi:uncharacterized ion transporter superfamily protein YfcC